MTKQEIKAYRGMLIENAAAAAKELKEAGYEKICGVIAGEDSGSIWLHPVTLEGAEVKVRNMNRIEYTGKR